MNRTEALAAIEAERERQIEVIGYDAGHDATHTPTGWVAIIAHELGAVADRSLNAGSDTYWTQRALIKTAAVCVAALEASDMRKENGPDQDKELEDRFATIGVDIQGPLGEYGMKAVIKQVTGAMPDNLKYAVGAAKDALARFERALIETAGAADAEE